MVICVFASDVSLLNVDLPLLTVTQAIAYIKSKLGIDDALDAFNLFLHNHFRLDSGFKSAIEGKMIALDNLDLESTFEIRTFLDHDPYKVLIRTILSQRTRDENTDQATNNLFAKYPDIYAVVDAPIDDVKELIRPAGFYNVKAARIQEVSQILIDEYTPAPFDDAVHPFEAVKICFVNMDSQTFCNDEGIAGTETAHQVGAQLGAGSSRHMRLPVRTCDGRGPWRHISDCPP